MIRYKSNKQMSIREFKTPWEIKLDKENRWAKLAEIIPWDELADIYYGNLSKNMGQPAIDARIVIGALIVKHKLQLDDREAIETIRENPYIQYFLGLSEYTYEDVFDRSLFTALRYRMGYEKFDSMTVELIKRTDQYKIKKTSTKSGKDKPPKKPDGSPGETATADQNQGKLLLDATVADQMIVYPTDLGLVNRSREESERIIDEICATLQLNLKPRTYRRNARKQYLNVAKKKHKTKREIRTAIGKQLRFLRRNLKSIDTLLDKAQEVPFPLDRRDHKIYFVIQHIYEQQMSMYKNGKHSIADRIVNIYQPQVRPIVRGKDKVQVEFGSKLGVSLQNGFARINTLSWDAYNESTELQMQVEKYKEANGYYPEVVITDKIYGTRENRNWLKERGIRFSGKPLGRPPTVPISPNQKKKQKIENGIRNQIEGKFGQGKNAYGLSRIRARAAKTSESWIACIMFVMNLIKFSQVFLCSVGEMIKIEFLDRIFWNIRLLVLNTSRICPEYSIENTH